MSADERARIVLETLDNVNRSYDGGRANTLIATDGGEVNPGAAYIELVRQLLALGNT